MGASPTPAAPTSYDVLGREEQAAVRTEWDQRATALRLGLDIEAELRAEGATWAEADAVGQVHIRH